MIPLQGFLSVFKNYFVRIDKKVSDINFIDEIKITYDAQRKK